MCFGVNARASSGISVSDSTSDTSTAADSVNDKALKNWPTTPESKPSGANTTTVVSVDPTIGAINSCVACAIAVSPLSSSGGDECSRPPPHRQ